MLQPVGPGDSTTQPRSARLRGADPAARDNEGKLPFNYAGDNEQLEGTDGYWKLNQARFE